MEDLCNFAPSWWSDILSSVTVNVQEKHQAGTHVKTFGATAVDPKILNTWETTQTTK